MADRFLDWLHRRDPDKAGLKKNFKHHQIFFEKIDANFVHQSEVTSESLLERFGVAELRKHLVASKFLESEFGIELTAEDKLLSVERERINTKLVNNRHESWGALLEKYSLWLNETDIPVRTHRLYLSCAESFCREVQLADSPWREHDIQRYLEAHPGARANLFKFVGHCKRVYGWDVAMPPRQKNKETTVPNTVQELKKLLLRVSAEGVDEVDIDVLEKIIAKSLGYPTTVFKNSDASNFHLKSGKTFFTYADETSEIPQDLLNIIYPYLRRRYITIDLS
jgi:uncharacterized protein YacL (UPF0231 family)